MFIEVWSKTTRAISLCILVLTVVHRNCFVIPIVSIKSLFKFIPVIIVVKLTLLQLTRYDFLLLLRKGGLNALINTNYCMCLFLSLFIALFLNKVRDN